VEITATGWRVIDNPAVRFRRAAGMQPLPMPAVEISFEREGHARTRSTRITATATSPPEHAGYAARRMLQSGVKADGGRRRHMQPARAQIGFGQRVAIPARWRARFV
jgi:hypothetical protein